MKKTYGFRVLAVFVFAFIGAVFMRCDLVNGLLGLGDDEEKDAQVTIAFDGNGGTWERDGTSVTRLEVAVKKGDAVPLPNENPSKEAVGAFCVGWNTASDSSGQKVNGSTVIGRDMVVYAQWKSLGEDWNDENGVIYKDFVHSGAVQTFVVSYAARYKFELWGANGDGNAKGGYSSGSLELAEGSTLSLYVGGKGGARSGTYGAIGGVGGWNGGGAGGEGYYNNEHGGGGGGGATDVRLESGFNTRIIVAGGAGGAGGQGTAGGAGGGQAGGAGGIHSGTAAAGGTQIGGNSFGIGGASTKSSSHDYAREGRGGGGGGYWGGRVTTTTPSYWAGGGGGSGFVYGYDQTHGVGEGDDKWIPVSYQGYIFTGDFACIAGAEGHPNPATSGHGYIRVIYMP